jgi:hypothetical protein
MPANDLAAQYLHTFAANGEFPGGLAFRPALAQAKLDFTPASLQRIDLLLRQIRAQLQPQYAAFIDRQENQNFLYLLCFYVGAVVYRYTREDFAWYAYDELKQVAPPDFLLEYPECFGSSMMCMLKDSGTFLPLSSILDVLFEDDAGRSVMASAEKFMGRLPGVSPIARPPAAVVLRDDKVTQAMRATASHAGWAASFAISMVCEGASLGRMLQHRFHDGRRLNISLMDSALQEAFDRLERNDDQAAQSVLVYEGVVGLPAFRSRAIVLEARGFTSPQMTLTLAVPYRAAAGGARFAVFQPQLLRPTTLNAAAHQVIAAGFFEGIDAYRPVGLLDKYLDTST